MATSPTNISHLRLSQERPASTFNGFVMLLVLLLTIVVGLFGLVMMAAPSPVPGVLIMILDTIAFIIVISGFYLLQPNTAAALLLFGDYKGTDRTTGRHRGVTRRRRYSDDDLTAGTSSPRRAAPRSRP